MNSVLFCGLVTALGWGLRGEFGGMFGAMIPGAFLGLAIAVTSCREDWLRKAVVFGMAGTLGMAIGGNMSYGRVIGFSKGNDFINVAYGYAMLGLLGALWGAFAAGVIAVVASPKKYRLWQLAALIVAAYGVGTLAAWLLIDALGWSMNNDPERGEFWASMVGINLALVVFARLKADPIPVRVMAWGFLAGGFGFTVGAALQVLGSDLGPEYDWWKVMEQSFGFILGAGIAYGVRRECAGIARTPPTPLWLSAFSIAVVAWLVPVVTANDVIDHAIDQNVLRNDVAGDQFVAHFALVFWVALFLVLLTTLWRGYTASGPVDSRSRAIGLLWWVIWTCTLLGALKKGVPAWSEHSLWVHQGFLAMAVVATFWSLVDFHHDVGWYIEPRPLRWTLVKLGLLFVITVVLLAAVSIPAHNGEWRGDARIRFEHYAKPDAILD